VNELRVGGLTCNSEEVQEHSIRSTPPDSGISLIEVLVSVVLLGTAVVAMLVAVRVSVIGSRVERDHSKALQALQSAVGIVQDQDFGECSNPSLANKQFIISGYQTSIDRFAGMPEGFDGTIRITDLKVWDQGRWIDFSAQTVCLDDRRLRQQLVTVEARARTGGTVEVRQIVKRDAF
jgi:hypothetical protein